MNENKSSVITVLIAQSDFKRSVDIQDAILSNLNIKIVGVVSTGKDLLTWLLHSKVDIVLCDFYLPYLDGIFLMQVVSSFDSKSKFLFYSDFDFQWMVRKAINLGAGGFVSMKNDIRLLNNAIDVISKGGTYLDDLTLYKFFQNNDSEFAVGKNT